MAFLLVWISWSDLKKRKVPNQALLLLLAVVLATTPFRISQVLLSLVVLIVGIIAFQYRWLGAGDSKLLTVCVYASLDHWYWLLLQTALIGGVLSVLCLVHNRLADSGVLARPPVKTVPYAVAISSAAFTTFHYM